MAAASVVFRISNFSRLAPGVLAALSLMGAVPVALAQNFTGNAYDVLSRALAPYLQAAFPPPGSQTESGLALRFRIAAASGAVPSSLSGGGVRLIGFSQEHFLMEITPPSSSPVSLLRTPEGIRIAPPVANVPERTAPSETQPTPSLDLSRGVALLLPALVQIPNPSSAEITPHAGQQVRHIFSTLPVEIFPAPTDDLWRVTWWVDDQERFRGLRVARQGIEFALYLLDARMLPASEITSQLEDARNSQATTLPASALPLAIETLFSALPQTP